MKQDAKHNISSAGLIDDRRAWNDINNGASAAIHSTLPRNEATPQYPDREAVANSNLSPTYLASSLMDTYNMGTNSLGLQKQLPKYKGLKFSDVRRSTTPRMRNSAFETGDSKDFLRWTQKPHFSLTCVEDLRYINWKKGREGKLNSLKDDTRPRCTLEDQVKMRFFPPSPEGRSAAVDPAHFLHRTQPLQMVQNRRGMGPLTNARRVMTKVREMNSNELRKALAPSCSEILPPLLGGSRRDAREEEEEEEEKEEKKWGNNVERRRGVSLAYKEDRRRSQTLSRAEAEASEEDLSPFQDRFVKTESMVKLLCPYSAHMIKEKRTPVKQHTPVKRAAAERAHQAFLDKLKLPNSRVDESNSNDGKLGKGIRGLHIRQGDIQMETPAAWTDPRNAGLVRTMLGKESDKWHAVGANYWGEQTGRNAREVVPYCTSVYGHCACKSCREVHRAIHK